MLQILIENQFMNLLTKNIKTMNNEIWKPVSENLYYMPMDLSKRYECSNLGRVRNVKTGRILKGSVKPNGDVQVHLRTQWLENLHLLLSHVIYETFVGNAYEKQVRHRDGNKLNNNVNNLYI